MKQVEHHFLACLLVHGEPPAKLYPQGDPANTHEYGKYRDRVQKWWIDRVTSYPAAKPAAGIRFFRRYMQWYNTQKREQDDD